jgi:hypothetical protein
MTPQAIIVAIALCCTLVILAMTAVFSPAGFTVTTETPYSSQTANCWVKLLCDPADDFASED